MTIEHQISRSDENIFADVGFSTEEAELLRIRADLMLALRRLIEVQHWTIEQAAQQFGTSKDQIEALIQGEIEQFLTEPRLFKELKLTADQILNPKRRE